MKQLYEELKKEIKHLREDVKNLDEKIAVKTFVDNVKPPEPMPVVCGCPVGSIGKNGLTKEEIIGNKGLEKSIASILNGEEHNCDKNCFAEHVLPAIQSDYNYKVLEFMLDSDKRHYFIEYWNQQLKKEYNFIENLYMIADTIMVRFK